jgi:death-on-curing protein
MIYLTYEQVIELHDVLIQKFGGLAGVREIGLLESALAVPMMAVFGRELHKSVYDKAGAYLYHIARNHPFCDGNKRTASATAIAFLRVNGENPHYDIENFLKLVVSVAEGRMDAHEISHYFRKACS